VILVVSISSKQLSTAAVGGVEDRLDATNGLACGSASAVGAGGPDYLTGAAPEDVTEVRTSHATQCVP